jgi:hypothetical protein
VLELLTEEGFAMLAWKRRPFNAVPAAEPVRTGVLERLSLFCDSNRSRCPSAAPTGAAITLSLSHSRKAEA